MPAVSHSTSESQDVVPSPHLSFAVHNQPDCHSAEDEDEDSAVDLSTPGSVRGDDVFSPSLTPASTWSSISSTAEDPVVRDYLSSHPTSAPSVENGSVGSYLTRSDRLCGFNSKRPHSSTCEPCSEDRYEHDRFPGMTICLSHLDTMQKLSKGDTVVEKLLSGFQGAPRAPWEQGMDAEPSGAHRTHESNRACPSTEVVSAASSDTVLSH